MSFADNLPTEDDAISTTSADFVETSWQNAWCAAPANKYANAIRMTKNCRALRGTARTAFANGRRMRPQ